VTSSFIHLTICGISLFLSNGPRLVDLSEGAAVAIKVAAGSLCVYLGPLHMILDRA
jgi:hypothetical protein